MFRWLSLSIGHFNYEGERSREIFSFILKYNRCSRFHFEIGAHLLDQQTLELLATVPGGIFNLKLGCSPLYRRPEPCWPQCLAATPG